MQKIQALLEAIKSQMAASAGGYAAKSDSGRSMDIAESARSERGSYSPQVSNAEMVDEIGKMKDSISSASNDDMVKGGAKASGDE